MKNAKAEETNQIETGLSVKKDVIWKPFLRGFRAYYRNKLDHIITTLYN